MLSLQHTRQLRRIFIFVFLFLFLVLLLLFCAVLFRFGLSKIFLSYKASSLTIFRRLLDERVSARASWTSVLGPSKLFFF